MLYIASVSLISLLASAALLLAGQGSPVAVAHLAFAVGILPLIFAAMMHFVPVLTRSRDPHPWLARMPLAAQFSGVLVVGSMQGWLRYEALYAAAGLDLAMALMLLIWIIRRARQALGRPHPGWRWYGASLVCLQLALCAVLLSAVFPGSWHIFRVAHVHLNPIGFVGLAALGTLPVLLPTALAQPDPDAASWLSRWLKTAIAGVIMVSFGASISKPLSMAGAAVLLLVLIILLGQWQRCFGVAKVTGQGAAASLLAACVGGVLMVGSGPLHGIGLLPPRGALAGWAAGFLLPLVTGALSQLLPVWRWPGMDSSRRQGMRLKLSRSGLLRGILFLLAAGNFFLGQWTAGSVLTLLGMLLFAANVIGSIRIPSATR